ncbi:MAG TPA: hypothetical protein VFN67_14965 [Polyangiales bacterium]|nr:hypothetical protein [Polyangiales bacterium]
MHLKVADAPEQRAHDDDPGVSMREIAHHLLAALPASDVMRAVAYAQRAATIATHVGAYADACRLLRRALDALQLQPGIDPKINCELLYLLANRGYRLPDWSSSPGQLPDRGPHRSGRAQFGHPALRFTGSLLGDA